MRKTIAALAATAAVGTGIVGAATASAAPAAPAVAKCTPSQFTTTLLAGDPGAGQRYATIRFTAKAGRKCTLPGHLPVTLTGAHNVLIDDEAPADAPPVTISAGHPAQILLHWTAIEAEQDQQTPLAISVAGHDLPWNQGSVDATPNTHTIDVGAVTKVS